MCIKKAAETSQHSGVLNSISRVLEQWNVKIARENGPANKMADLLQSLLTARPGHLQNQTEAGMYSPSSSIRPPSPKQLPGEFPNASPDTPDASQAFVDADEFLQSIPTGSGDGDSNATPALQPVRIGQSRTSEHSVAFHKLAQEKRITPVFEYEEVSPQRFGVKLTLEGRVVVKEAGPWPSKKAAKEAVCKRGIHDLSEMKGTVNPPPPSNGENWVGTLQEFYDLDPTWPRPVYTDFAVGNQFACELVIDKHYAPFGGCLVKFPSKKAAKANAARKAVEWLIANNYMGPEGPPTRKRRKGSGGGGTAAVTTTMGPTGVVVEIKRNTSYLQKVNGKPINILSPTRETGLKVGEVLTS
ncbi:hypothetical protein GP486_002355 [Trichoglossum hirsutum]|uniref:DRBM domain-containing protein n=1 Tax=Trichoglossum hirsutum TaxID=265104 RepID=A0A9P8RRR5_9PEZI|nr:hypothetical protein GP486_002355 [Trichoglossum hirsutum]